MDEVVTFNYKNKKIPVLRSILMELRRNAAEMHFNPDELIDAMLEKTYQELSKRDEVEEKRERLLTLLQQGINSSLQLLTSDQRQGTSSNHYEENPRDRLEFVSDAVTRIFTFIFFDNLISLE